MIYGVGTDIVMIARIESLLDRYGERFARRVLGPDELAEYRRRFGKRRTATVTPPATWPSASPPRRRSPRRSAWGCAGR